MSRFSKLDRNRKDLNSNDVAIPRRKIDQLDNKIAHVLRKVRRSAEGNARRNPCSTEKIKIRAAMIYWKTFLRKKEGESVPQTLAQKRKIEANVKRDHARIARCS